jgi:hypothetical protein
MITDVIQTLSDALQDPATGLTAKANALTGALQNIRTDYFYEKWVLSGQLKMAGQPNVAIAPTAGAANLKIPAQTLRDGEWRLDISVEFFDADPQVIMDNVGIATTALFQVLDTLREYSDAHGGTVMQVLEPVGLRFGQFAGVSSTNGFTATATIQERGNT